MTVFSRRLLVTCTALGLGVMAGQQAQAHGIESSLRYLDGQLELSSSFSTGEPVEGAAVRLLNADGTPGEELGEIGANGQLVLTLPGLDNSSTSVSGLTGFLISSATVSLLANMSLR